MTIPRMLAAATLIVSTLGIAGTADAQGRHDDHRGYQQNGRHDDRRDNRYGDRGHHYGRDRHAQRCRVEWRHHRQVRVCR